MTKTQKMLWKIGSIELYLLGILVKLFHDDISHETRHGVLVGNSSAISHMQSIIKNDKKLQIFCGILALSNDIYSEYLVNSCMLILGTTNRGIEFASKLKTGLLKLNVIKNNEYLKTVVNCMFEETPTNMPLITVSNFYKTLTLSSAAFIEESSKLIASKLGFLTAYQIIFNSAEFTGYVTHIQSCLNDREQVIQTTINMSKKLDKNVTMSQDDVSKLYEQLKALKNIFSQVGLKQKFSYTDVKNICNNSEKSEILKRQLEAFAAFKTSKLHKVLEPFITRIMPLLMHIINSVLHIKNKSLYAVLIHLLWNSLFVTLISAFHRYKDKKKYLSTLNQQKET